MKIIDSKKLTNLSWLNLFNVSYADRNGVHKIWQVASRVKKPKCVTRDFDTPDAVVMVPFHKSKKKMVITKEYRVPLADYEYGFPAGLIDEGETVRDAARRELKEETGLYITRFIKMGPSIYSSAGMTDESVSMVYIECDGTPSTHRNEGSEDIQVMLVSREDALRLCNDASLKFDAKAWIVMINFGKFGGI